MTKNFFKIFPRSALVLFALGFLGSCTSKNKEAEAVLRIPIVADAKNFDPIFAEDRHSNYVNDLVYECLVEYDYLKRPATLRPSLAASWEVSKDGLTYTFKLKPGVKYIDHKVFEGGKGRDVVAKDVVYSFLRLADPKLNSPGFWLFDGHIVGINAWREKNKNAATTDYANPPEGIKALDDSTVQLKVVQKYPQLLYVLAMSYASVIPPEAVEKLGKDFVNEPVGTGPYKLVRWSRNSKIEFERNPTFHGDAYPTEGEAEDMAKGRLADAGKALPIIPRLELQVYVESTPQWLNFLKGELDISGIPKDYYKGVIDPKTQELTPEFAEKNLTLQKVVEPDVTYIAFNLDDPTIKKGGPNLRKAISLAINHPKELELFYNGRGIQAQSPLPPTVAGYDKDFKNPYKEYNVEKAKEYLKKSGFPNGVEIAYESTQGTDSRQMAEMLKADLEVIGVKLTINVNQFSELSQKLNTKKAQMWGIAWGGDYPDAENFLQLLYGPNSAPGPNASNYNNPKYNSLYVKMRGMADSPERRKIISEMVQISTEDAPWVPGIHRIVYSLQQPWLKNYKADNPNTGATGAEYLNLDMERKKQGVK